MTRRKAVLASALLLGVGAGLAYLRYRMKAPNVLRVGYPFAVLRQDQKLLDPDNTEFAYQYYLLENLAIGLVRDSSQSPSGYGPGLAESWERLSPTRWAFHLRPALTWSDGTPIKPADLAAHVESLSREKRRHVVYLKKLRRATVEDRSLILEFSVPVNDGLIHELSLADAALLHPDNRAKDWRVTSGAFSVDSYEPGKRLVLRRNAHFPGESGYPERVELVNFTMDTIGDFFDSVDVDLLKLPIPVFRSPIPKLLSRAPQVSRGYPTWIYYLYFNSKKALWREARARREFALIVQRSLDGFAYSSLARECQLIPKGYSGRLDNDCTPKAIETADLARQRVKINLLPAFTDAAPVLDALKTGFGKAGVALDIGYARDLDASKDDADAQMSQFAGNQHDAMGSWQFMFSPDQGDLRYFRKEVKPLFDRIIAAEEKAKRETEIRALHEHVLEETYAVPLFIESDQIAASKRVDLSRLNPFDMRLRFYEVSWK
ncbi:MAG: ABC transporter substrate-binding protein [Elusimicrobiota bacterium]|nr:ABC transporter substrate-binding protein [Elusimicrobiota bacterium]